MSPLPSLLRTAAALCLTLAALAGCDRPSQPGVPPTPSPAPENQPPATLPSMPPSSAASG